MQNNTIKDIDDDDGDDDLSSQSGVSYEKKKNLPMIFILYNPI